MAEATGMTIHFDASGSTAKKISSTLLFRKNPSAMHLLKGSNNLVFDTSPGNLCMDFDSLNQCFWFYNLKCRWT